MAEIDAAVYAGVVAENIALRKRVKELKAEVHKTNEIAMDYARERDEALAQWHAHQKNVPCAGCVGGHDTYWKTVIESPQWKAWEESHPQWDIDECRECGHISQAHFQAFLSFCSGAEAKHYEDVAQVATNRYIKAEAAIAAKDAEIQSMTEKLEYIRSAYCDDLNVAKEFADKALTPEPGPGGERVYDKPCYCREQVGQEQGHVHASQPTQENPHD